MRMTRLIPTFALAIASLAAACGKSDTNKADSSLSSDLSLAGQQQAHLDSVSALEANAANARTSSLRSTSASSTVRHHSTTSSSSGVSSSSAPVATSSSSGEVTVKHTQRDAAIGAGAGAILGAVTSKNKLKGGIIGGVLGGVLGGVVGNNVDKTKKKPPTE